VPDAGGVVQGAPGEMASRSAILPPMAQPVQPTWKQDTKQDTKADTKPDTKLESSEPTPNPAVTPEGEKSE
jgi:hypothetical protein